MALSDTFFRIASLEEADRRNKILEQDRLADEEDRKTKAAIRQVALKKMMASDMYKRAKASGLEGPELENKLMELLPAYQSVYSKIGGDLGFTSPGEIIAAGGTDPAEEEARAEELKTQANLRVRSQYGETAIDKYKIGALEAQRGNLPQGYRFGQGGGAERIPGLDTPEQDLQRQIRLEQAKLQDRLTVEDRQHQYRLAEEQAKLNNTAPKPLTYEQGKASSFLSRMKTATDVIDELSGKGFSPDQGYGIAAKFGGLNELAGRSRYASMDENGQKWAQAEDEWVNAMLRTDTGAAYAKIEPEDIKAIFFPRAGDKDSVILQKKRARDSMMEGMVPMTGSRMQPEGMGAPQMPTGIKQVPREWMLPDGRVIGPNGITYRFAR
jgi:hypothetical protein